MSKLITMERNPTETVAPENSDVGDSEEVIADSEFENILQYVKDNRHSTNTQLFSFLVLLKAYLPESYLLMSECQQILGPPDPIYGGPPFEERMKPFIALINTSNPSLDHVCMNDKENAHEVMEELHRLKISRSATVRKFMSALCGKQAEPYIIQYIKDLLTKREMGEKGLNKFSELIIDIMKQEHFNKAVFVLETASKKFKTNPMLPQTLARLYYIKRHFNVENKALYFAEVVYYKSKSPNYEKAEDWAKIAIERAPENSYVADTLGQIYKNSLMRAQYPNVIRAMTEKAFKAFKDVEEKAEKEEGPEMKDVGHKSISNFFNNRGLFGFIQVANIVFKKSEYLQEQSFTQSKKMEVEAKFDFFEWYLIYSKPNMTTLEPYYFWKDVAHCYQHYTNKTASESTSFPGLLDCLNHGLFLSKGKRAGFEEVEKTVSELEEIQNVLKTTYEDNTDDVEVAKRYILSNIILSNKMPDSPHLTPLTQLRTIIHRFMDKRQSSPEFYFLVLLLFWPEEQAQMLQKDDNEEVKQQATRDDGSEDKTWEDKDIDEDQETGQEPAQLPADLGFVPDLEQYVTLMEKEFERTQYAKYLRGRYLLPLFFLGKGSGLSKWIHKSKLDAIVEKKVDTEPADESNEKTKEKRINEMWMNGEVWQVPEIKDVLLPVAVEPCHSPTIPQEHEEQVVFVCAGGKKLKAFTEVESDASAQSPVLFYLGFTIRGPVVFKVGPPHTFNQ